MTDNATETMTLSVFITGGDTGMGRLLTRTLVKRGCRVTGTTHTAAGAAAIRADGALPTYPDLARPGDLRGLLMMAKADVVVHLAASPLNGAPQYTADYNAAMKALTNTDEIALAAGQAGVKRLIFPSFAFLYGDTKGVVVDETAPVSRENDLFKTALEAEAAVLDGGVPGYVLRTGYVYGGHSEALRALQPRLSVGGSVASGKKTAAWLHEDDLLTALVKLVEYQPARSETAQLFNLAEENSASPDVFINEFGTVMGVGEPAKMPDIMVRLRLPEFQRMLLDTSFAVNSDKFKAAFDWKVTTASRLAGLDKALLVWRAEANPEPQENIVPERAIVTV